ncbi:MAG TPA: hypothetical protein DCM40_14835, partial [Maribacter sp.]|nr:hypothetical protein [Maribacter sp.]
EEFIRAYAEGGGEDLINSIEDLATTLQDVTSEMSSDIDYPAAATSHIERYGGYTSFLINTFTGSSGPSQASYGVS